jgi:hypothetical protein
MNAPTVAALRQLLGARFPEKSRGTGAFVPTGVPAVDELLGGGLPARRLTELVSAAPSSGGQTVLARLRASTRAARQRVALVDGADAFDPDCVPQDALRHLVWVRIPALDAALPAADILVRDGNYAAVVLDLRGIAESALRKIPATSWYRLQRAAEGAAAAVLVQTCLPLVPSAAARLLLSSPLALVRGREPRGALAASLAVERERAARYAEKSSA